MTELEKLSAKSKMLLETSTRRIFASSSLANPKLEGLSRETFRLTSNRDISDVTDGVVRNLSKAGLSGSAKINFRIAELSRYQLKIVPPLASRAAHL